MEAKTTPGKSRVALATGLVSLLLAGTAMTNSATAAARTSGEVLTQATLLGDDYTEITASELLAAYRADPLVQATLAQLEAERSSRAQSAVTAPGIASRFGQEVLKGIARGAGGTVLDEVLASLGFDPSRDDEVLSALADIQSSLELVLAHNREIVLAIEDLHNEVHKANFTKANASVVQATNNISDIVDVTRIWLRDGVTPDQSTVTLSVLALREHTTNLRGAASDVDSGAVPLLMLAYDRNVSDTEQLWEVITNYRDQVRVSLAQGIAGLELLIQHWDNPSGEYHGSYETARNSSVDTVDAMYGLGVQPDGPGGQSFLQLQGDLAVSAFADVPAEDQWLWEEAVTNAASHESLLSKLANSYRPANHEGRTLQETMTAHGLPTSYVFPDSWGKHTSYDYKALKTRRDVYYTPQVKLGEIVGNTYQARHVTFGDRVLAGNQDERCTLPWINCRWEWLNDFRDSANRAIDNANREWALAAQGLPSANLQRWINESHRHNNAQAWVLVSKSTNGLSGFLTDGRPEAIEQAAYGTD